MKSLVSLLVLAAAVPAFAEEAAPAADPLSFNVGAVSEYRYRGISQSRLKPALQGGVDYAAANGFYVGTWASTIKWIKDIPGGDGDVEIDLYGGYKTEVAKGLTLDLGGLYYLYPSNKLKDVSRLRQRQHLRALRRRDLRPGDGQVLAQHHQPVRQRQQQEQRLLRRVRQLRPRRRYDADAARGPPEHQASVGGFGTPTTR